MALVADFAISSLVVAGFADGTVKAYDCHIIYLFIYFLYPIFVYWD